MTVWATYQAVDTIMTDCGKTLQQKRGICCRQHFAEICLVPFPRYSELFVESHNFSFFFLISKWLSGSVWFVSHFDHVTKM